MNKLLTFPASSAVNATVWTVDCDDADINRSGGGRQVVLRTSEVQLRQTRRSKRSADFIALMVCAK